MYSERDFSENRLTIDETRARECYKQLIQEKMQLEQRLLEIEDELAELLEET